MNAIKGEILDFIENDELSLVSVGTTFGELKVLMLGFSQSLNAQKGTKVELLFKENELILAQKGAKIATDNAFSGKITGIEKGKVLWQVFLKPNLSATMTAQAAKALNLSPNDEVACFVKADDIIIRVL